MVDIRAAGLVKSFDLEKRILDGLSFQVDSGERVGLLGRNGAGKTTVFRMLTGELHVYGVFGCIGLPSSPVKSRPESCH